MDGSFTVFHNGQFWVGVLEVAGAEGVRAAQHVFGPEPTNAELLEFARGRDFDELSARAHAAPPVPAEQRPKRRRTAKRAARLAAREQGQDGIGTAAQRALKEDLAQRRAASARVRKQGRAEAAEHRRQRAAAKAKARHRGKA